MSLIFITKLKFTERKWSQGTRQITAICQKKVFALWHKLTTNQNLTRFPILSLSLNRSQVIRNQWNDLSADLIKASQIGSAGNDPVCFSNLANNNPIALRIVDNTLATNTARQLPCSGEVYHKPYLFIKTSDPHGQFYFRSSKANTAVLMGFEFQNQFALGVFSDFVQHTRDRVA